MRDGALVGTLTLVTLSLYAPRRSYYLLISTRLLLVLGINGSMRIRAGVPQLLQQRVPKLKLQATILQMQLTALSISSSVKEYSFTVVNQVIYIQPTRGRYQPHYQLPGLYLVVSYTIYTYRQLLNTLRLVFSSN